MNFDTHFNAETAWNYRSGLPEKVSKDLLLQRMAALLEDAGEYMEEWRRYIVLECWARQENPEETAEMVRDWLRALKGRDASMLWVCGSLRAELSRPQMWLQLEAMPLGNWVHFVRVDELPDLESARLRMMWWQPHFWVNRQAVERFAPMAYLQWDMLMKEEEWTSERLTGLVRAMVDPSMMCELPLLS